MNTFCPTWPDALKRHTEKKGSRWCYKLRRSLKKKKSLYKAEFIYYYYNTAAAFSIIPQDAFRSHTYCVQYMTALGSRSIVNCEAHCRRLKHSFWTKDNCLLLTVIFRRKSTLWLGRKGKNLTYLPFLILETFPSNQVLRCLKTLKRLILWCLKVCSSNQFHTNCPGGFIQIETSHFITIE